MNDVSKGLFILVTFILLHFIVDNIDINLDDDDNIVEGFKMSDAKDGLKKATNGIKNLDKKFKIQDFKLGGIGDLLKSIAKLPEAIGEFFNLITNDWWGIPVCILPGAFPFFLIYIFLEPAKKATVLLISNIIYVLYYILFSLPVRIIRQKGVNNKEQNKVDKKVRNYIKKTINKYKDDVLMFLLYFVAYSFYLVPIIGYYISGIFPFLQEMKETSNKGDGPERIFKKLSDIKKVNIFSKDITGPRMDFFNSLFFTYIAIKILYAIPKDKFVNKIYDLIGLNYIFKFLSFVKFIFDEITKPLKNNRIVKLLGTIFYMPFKLLIWLLTMIKDLFLYLVINTPVIGKFLKKNYKYYKFILYIFAIIISLGLIVSSIPNPESEVPDLWRGLSNISLNPVLFGMGISHLAAITIIVITLYSKIYKKCFKMYDQLVVIKKVVGIVYSAFLELLKIF